ncbi:AMP-dependent synthetase and ligase family protein [Actinidia rufa]|uniref:AMP-dependent synthetase and ligase family protein n=1 Tax=Actinidia rufa TaxID=165716 RepID=A0A7J0H8C0_9ERIC|nr:AMP-dependent synthetase and ligase family protein [Actinidia rufa]
MSKFAVVVEEGREEKDGKPSVGPVYRNILAKNGFPAPDPDLTTTWDSFRVSVEKYPSNRMLGWREFKDGKFGPYLWKTYKEVYEEVLHIGSALRASGAEPGCRVGIYGSNCPQWIVAMEACNAHSLICVPLYDTLGPGAVNFIIDHAEIDFVFTQDKKIKELLNPECTHAKRLKLIVCFTSLTEEDKEKTVYIDVKPYSWNEFLDMGKDYPSKLSPPQPFNICTIMYTSGTSGDPKGVILTHENAATNISGLDLFLEHFEDKMTMDDVYISFLPLAHILDRMIEEYFFHKGASVGYYRGVKSRLGGRIRLIVSGGAPLSSEVEEFLRVTSCAFVTQGYGLTETCGLATNGFPDEMSMLGTVGPPFVYSELRLEEVPEMGYNPLGNPPRGEICMRGKSTFAGYYKNPELTRETLRDGWFHTGGDIGEILPNGAVKIIDRKKHLIKLSQGEYVALEYLEKVYGITPIVEDIWVYGDSFKSMLVAVVVLHEDNTRNWADQNGHRGSLSELCSLNRLQDYVLVELKSTAQRTKVFDEMPVRDVVSWNTMGLHKLRNPPGIYYCFLPMERDAFRPNEITVLILISTLMNTGFCLLITQLHGFAFQLCLNSSAFVGSALMRGYTHFGDCKSLCQVFDEISVKDVTSWNALILV